MGGSLVPQFLAARQGASSVCGGRKLGLELGLGAEVPSGIATVGAIAGTGRLEYGAVGPVVNLASRLANRAEAGQVLAEPRVVGLAASDNGAYRFQKLETAELKGFARPVTLFTVESPQRAGDVQP
jgi:class 3 adenylate cyclase